MDSRNASPTSGISEPYDELPPKSTPRSDLSISLLNMGSPASHALPGVEKLEIHATATALIGGRHLNGADGSSTDSEEDNSREGEIVTVSAPLETIQEHVKPHTDSSAVESVLDETETQEDPTRRRDEDIVAVSASEERQRRHAPQRSGSRHLAALSKISASFPDEPKEGKALGPKLEDNGAFPQQRERQISGSWRRIILPPQPPSRQRRRGRSDRALLELARLSKPQRPAPLDNTPAIVTPRSTESQPAPLGTPSRAMMSARLVTPPQLSPAASHTSLSGPAISTPFRTFTAGSRFATEYLSSAGQETPFPRIPHPVSPPLETSVAYPRVANWIPTSYLSSPNSYVASPHVVQYSHLRPTFSSAPPLTAPPAVPSPSYTYKKAFMW
eukprot:Gregarina_sp_Poly_1__3525@NODE_2029_length_2829_cov_223_234613_g1312_i0_p2_GENE_NODE_2029_length_2829_cov_223_234613_g1312_i0NODE_2029_length_2829_cov_223_234613_g1312_i0_p2_ORF_typecomplete_len387_score78_10_NODE_2029_length_2829_cov_223_234613_g1312_i013012461